MRLSLFAAAVMFSASLAAHADELYSFVGAGYLAGTYFTVEAPTFLAYSFTGIPVTSGEIVFPTFGGDEGPAMSAVLAIGEIEAINANAGFAIPLDYDIAMNGTYSDSYGTLTISTVTPEPSSIALLGTGMLGLAGVIRKRFAV